MQSSDWNKRYAATDVVWSWVPNQFVVADLADLAAGRMIDVAGGEGRNALWFAERGWQAENIEFADKALERFSNRAAELGLTASCIATEADVTGAFEAALAPADLAVMSYLQVPADQLHRAIVYTVANLRPGGTFYGIFHDLENLTNGYAGPQNPAVLVTADQLQDAALQLGMTDIVVRARPREVIDAEGVTHTARDVSIIATKA